MRSTIFLFCLLSTITLFSQNIPIGSWRTHLSNYQIQSIVATKNKVYAASVVGGVFYYDIDNNSLHSVSRIDGLSDFTVTTLGYDKERDLLVIGYDNGNIDLVYADGSIYNVDDIKRKSIIGNKKINDIFFYKNYCYLSTDIGVVVLDIDKLEIKESYLNLGPNGISNRIFAATITDSGDSIYIATEYGVMSGKRDNTTNLLDYNNWKKYTNSSGVPSGAASHIVSFNNKIIASFDNNGLYYNYSGQWKLYRSFAGNGPVTSLTVSNNKMISTQNIFMLVYQDDSTVTKFDGQNINNPSDACFDRNDVLWFGDYYKGLYTYKNGTSVLAIPNGPRFNNSFHLYSYNNNIVSVTGGYNSSFLQAGNNAGYTVFRDNSYWENHNLYEDPDNKVYDLIDATYNPDNGKLYFASYGQGIYIVNPDGSDTLLNEQNSILNRYFGQLRIGGVTYDDATGDIWFSNHTVAPGDSSLFVIRKNGKWESYYLSKAGESGRSPMQIVIDDGGNKWMRLANTDATGVYVFNENGKKEKYMFDLIGNGALPDRHVNCITKDKKGDIWVGTDKGVAVYYDPSSVFSYPNDFSTPIYNQYPLLFTDVVTCIEVDGGNRKWIGTTKGLWLFNETGTEVIQNFTTENSPIISDFIMDVAINPNTGEVFIATDKGIISYRGTATEGKEEMSEALVFPNPVKPDFTGVVAIQGLASNSQIKITDIYGNLVYQTSSNGGTATWNLKDYNGIKAKTGVYLVFAATSDGGQKLVSKISVID